MLTKIDERSCDTFTLLKYYDSFSDSFFYISYEYFDESSIPENISKYDFHHQKAYNLLKNSVQQVYDIDIFSLTLLRTSLGKPYFESSDLLFNLSHCNGMAACIFTKASKNYIKIGIDIETLRTVSDKLIKKCCGEMEQQSLFSLSKEKKELLFMHYWTLKESYVKASGTGISLNLSTICFDECFHFTGNNKNGKCDSITFPISTFGQPHILSFCILNE